MPTPALLDLHPYEISVSPVPATKQHIEVLICESLALPWLLPQSHNNTSIMLARHVCIYGQKESSAKKAQLAPFSCITNLGVAGWLKNQVGQVRTYEGWVGNLVR